MLCNNVDVCRCLYFELGLPVKTRELFCGPNITPSLKTSLFRQFGVNGLFLNTDHTASVGRAPPSFTPCSFPTLQFSSGAWSQIFFARVKGMLKGAIQSGWFASFKLSSDTRYCSTIYNHLCDPNTRLYCFSLSPVQGIRSRGKPCSRCLIEKM